MSYIFSFCVLIYFKKQIFFIFTVPLFDVKKIEETSFILNNRIQLIETHVLICLFLSFLILVPIFILQIFWFVFSGATIVENKRTKKV
jgi:Sec-independent protein secretion pathway component TatC